MKKVQPVFNIELSSSDSDQDPETQILNLKESLIIPDHHQATGHTQALNLSQVTDFVQSFKSKKSLNTSDYLQALVKAQNDLKHLN